MIRPEQSTDIQSIHDVHAAAFPTKAEAKLVDALRANQHLLVSLVALKNSNVIGHVALSPVTLHDCHLTGAGLAPVAVLPAQQRIGYGSQLIQAGLDACRQAAIDYVVVLGEPNYYRRFGFRTATKFGLQNEYGVVDEFMAIELTPDCLHNRNGLVRYGPEFQDLG